MKITYRSYPILKKLENENLGKMSIHKKDNIFFEKNLSLFNSNWQKHCKDFKKELNFLDPVFRQSLVSLGNMTFEFYEHSVNNDKSDVNIKGCFFTKNFVFMISYEINKDVNNLSFFMFDKESTPLLMFENNDSDSVWVSKCVGFSKNAKEIFFYKTLASIYFCDILKKFKKSELSLLLPYSEDVISGKKITNKTNFHINYFSSDYANILAQMQDSEKSKFRIISKDLILKF